MWRFEVKVIGKATENRHSREAIIASSGRFSQHLRRIPLHPALEVRKESCLSVNITGYMVKSVSKQEQRVNRSANNDRFIECSVEHRRADAILLYLTVKQWNQKMKNLNETRQISWMYRARVSIVRTNPLINHFEIWCTISFTAVLHCLCLIFQKTNTRYPPLIPRDCWLTSKMYAHSSYYYF